jgi:myo-inositol 2-dehydrogenase/D-chiro-inositol 1-dehydrogenase
MINFALLGTGRIGKLHASIINAHPEASLKYVYDIDTSSAKKLQKNIVVKLQRLQRKQFLQIK